MSKIVKTEWDFMKSEITRLTAENEKTKELLKEWIDVHSGYGNTKCDNPECEGCNIWNKSDQFISKE